MRKYLVVAHQTLGSDELSDAILERHRGRRATFHLLVPEQLGTGYTWDEGQVRHEAEEGLESALNRLTAAGISVTGETGEASLFVTAMPVGAVAAVLRRDGPSVYDEIILSTLPHKISKWLAVDAPARIRRASDVPLTVVTAASASEYTAI